MGAEYKCAMCGGVFEKGWTDEEASKEYMENFGPAISTMDDYDIVCDDCYNKVHPALHPEKVAATKLILLDRLKN